jgi:hypothetical protein
MKNVPFPIRFDGLNVPTVSHEGALLTIFQAELEFVHTETLRLPPTSPGLQVLCDSVSVGAPAWVTVMVRVGAPGAVTVIVPVRCVAPVFAVALILNKPLPVRFVGLNVSTVSHGALLLTAHVLLDATFTVTLPPPNGALHEVGDTVRVAAAAWITLIILSGAPGTATVMVPRRSVVPGFGVALIKNVPFPIRFDGLNVPTVSHEGALLTIFQTELEFVHTETLRLPPTSPGLHVLCDSVSVGAPAWVTVMVRVGAPGAVTVTVPVRCDVPVLAAAVILNEPLPVRLVGLNVPAVSHGALLLTAHVLLDATVTVTFPPVIGALHEVGDTVS